MAITIYLPVARGGPGRNGYSNSRCRAHRSVDEFCNWLDRHEVVGDPSINIPRTAILARSPSRDLETTSEAANNYKQAVMQERRRSWYKGQYCTLHLMITSGLALPCVAMHKYPRYERSSPTLAERRT